MAKSHISILTIFLISPFTISCWLMYPERCSPGCLKIYQWPSGFTALHVPTYTVQIVNEAWNANGGIYDVVLSCPAFASTALIDPKIFRRLDMDTCLLYDGRIITPGQLITFQYSNILPYPFLVTSLKCAS